MRRAKWAIVPEGQLEEDLKIEPWREKSGHQEQAARCVRLGERA